MRLSGLQREVLSLYRQCLRESRKKPMATRLHFESFTRAEFNKSIGIDKRDFAAIEFLLRKGRRQLEQYSAPGIKDIRIRVASPTEHDPNGLSISHLAALAVMERPLSESLQKLRRAQRALVKVRRRSKARVSFRHSVNSKSSAGNSQSAKGKSAAGKTSSGRNVVVAEKEEEARKDGEPTQHVDQQQGTRPSQEGKQDRHSPVKSPAKAKDDPKNDPKIDSRFSLMHVEEGQTSSGALPRSGPSTRARAKGKHIQEEYHHPEYAHVGPFDGLNPPGRAVRGYTPDPAAQSAVIRPVSASRHRPRRSVRYSPVPRSNFYPAPVARLSGRFDPTDPATLASIRRSLSQQHRLSSLTPSDSQVGAPSTPLELVPLPGLAVGDRVALLPRDLDVPSRTSSQIRQLHRFTKELEKFAMLGGASGRLPISTPTVTSTPASLNTIQELLPYREQFKAAGLAVTSEEQGSPKKLNISQLDGTARMDEPPGHPSSSGKGNNAISFAKSDDPLALALAEEVPQKSRRQSRGKRSTRSIIPWLRKKSVSTEAKAKVSKKSKDVQAPKPPRLSVDPFKDKPLPHRPTSMLGGTTMQLENGTDLQKEQEPEPTKVEDHPVLPPPPDMEPPPVPKKANTKHTPSPSLNSTQTERVLWIEKQDGNVPSSTMTTAQSSPQKHEGAALPVSTTKKTPKASADKIPTTIKEELEASPDKRKGNLSPGAERPTHNVRPPPGGVRVLPRTQDKENDNASRSQTHATARRDAGATKSLAPSLPETWTHDLSTPSSFEKALDNVVRKLDSMDGIKTAGGGDATVGGGKPRAQRTRNSGGRAAALSPSQKLQRASLLRRKRLEEEDEAQGASPAVVATQSSVYSSATTTSAEPNSRPVPKRPAPPPVALAVGSSSSLSGPRRDTTLTAVDHHDRDISDRDVLKGLKLAISAACDEDLDAWIRNKTGLRLRRFLADLRTFEHLEVERLSGADHRAERQRARRRRTEVRSLLLEERKRRGPN